GQIPEPTRKELEALYLSLNPAQLKRNIEMKLNKLYQAYQEKSRRDAVKPFKKQNPRMGLHFI
ncbi:hypothetical protein, partial [Candidatus Hakubella thermalkaliphila]